jgi:uncharacterized protein (TIGR02266 family)
VQPLFRNAERRRDPRIGARFEVGFKNTAAAAQAFKAFSVNFSAGGLCLKSSRQHAVGEAVELKLEVAGEKFELKGTVQWVKAQVVGVRFVDVSPADRVRLESVAGTLRREGAPLVDEKE